MEQLKTDLQQNIKITFDELYRSLDQFPQDLLDSKPFEASWSAGQVGEHLIKAMAGTPRLANGNTVPTTRAADQKVRAIKEMFLNMDKKMKSPERLEPTERSHLKNAQLLTIRVIEKGMLEVAEKKDLTLTCLDFELPGLGAFTIYEWVAFALTHAQRHIQQLNRIHKQLNV